MTTSNTASLFEEDPSKPPPVSFRQGVVQAWDPDTGANEITIAGGVLVNIPVLTSESATLEVGDVVSLATDGSKWLLFGKVTTPGDPGTVPSWPVDITALQADVLVAQAAADSAQTDATAAVGVAAAAQADAAEALAAAGSDGDAPASSPAVEVIGGWDVITARWTAITNADAVEYQVHISTDDGITPVVDDPDTLAGTTFGSFFQIKKMPGVPPADPSDPDARDFLFDVPYYVWIIATDADGAAAPGTPGFDTVYKIPGDSIGEAVIATEHLMASAVTADKLAARIVLATEFWTAETGQRVGMTPLGFFAYKPDGSIMLKIPTDSPEALYDGELIIRGATVLGGLSIQSAENELTADAALTLMRGISAPSATPQLQVVYDYLQPSTAGLTAAEKTNTAVGGFSMGGPFDLDPAQVTDLRWSEVADRFEITQIRSTGSRIWFFDTDGNPKYDAFAGSYFADLGEWEVWSSVDHQGDVDPTKNGVYRMFRYIPNGVNSYWVSSPPGINSYTRQNTAAAPVVGFNSTHFYIAEVVSSTHLNIKTYVPTGGGVALPAAITAYESNAGFAVARKLVAVQWHTSGFDQAGAARYLTAERDNGTKARLVYTQGTNAGSIHPGGVAFGPTSWASADIDAESFESPTTNRRGMTWDGTNFWTYSADGFLYKHEAVAAQWNPNAVSSIVWGKQAFADTDAAGTGTHVTKAGVSRSLTASRRAKIRWLPPDIPDNGGTDDPNAVNLYVARGATEPANASFHLQATGTSAAPAPIDFSTLATATATPPTTSTFPDTNPALVRNDDDTLQVDATGMIKGSSMFVASDEVLPAYPYYHAYLSVKITAFAAAEQSITTWAADGSPNSSGITYSAGVFTVPRAGLYRIKAQLWWNGLTGATGSRTLLASKNGTGTVVALSQLPPSTVNLVPMQNSIDKAVRLAAGDTLVLRVAHTHGAASISPDGTTPHFNYVQINYERP